ncbi:DUF2514 domain-containing protein [Comamonas thiooxydans]|uniref:DUF2514 domain-containing protein n=1 Tax=Comamonas thiooxydans TaxID=363952 RepID=UPI000A2E32B0|nr:DUF2514 domain-containing protein [Comamonas thiooxydans]BDR08605.1 DUF2514 domain-containing protein [Comamonas thiooxydans]
MKGRILLAILITLAAVFGARAWNSHLVAQGDAQGAKRVQQAWDQAEAKRQVAESAASAKAALQRAADETAARVAEQSKQKETERIAHEQAQREQASRAALDTATSRNRSLLTTIAQLNANAAAAKLSGPGSQSCSTADVDGATAARNALGECSSRYTALGGIADKLSGQVTGLQDYIRFVSTQKELADGY